MTHWAWLLPALPALAAVVGPATDRFMPGGPVVAGVAGALAALVVACLVLAGQWGSAVTHVAQTTWAPTGGPALHVGTSVDQLSATLVVVVALVALLVQVYSSAYMAGDRRYASYTAEVSLFTAAMMLTVVASSLIELLVGWEVMGLCSYLLVGHYWQTEGSRVAAVKALVTTRIGDAGFLVGIVLLGVGFQTFDIGAINNRLAPHIGSCAGLTGVCPQPGIPSHAVIVAGALLLLMGVVGKSAQFPLHVWLPDAMAGPTPISALIHAATMVAAGVYLVARMYPVFLAAPVVLTLLGALACVSMLGAALAALVQDDLKRVLAWSTVSQLGYMFAGLAVGGGQSAVYHLVGHAMFKALLFLAAGSVLRAVGTNLMSEMGGLWRRMPVTFGTAVIGAASLAGIPPLAGAFGKAGIADAARLHGGALGITVEVVAEVTELVTALYVTRLICRTFLGRPRTDATVHESPAVMTVPLVVLSAATVGVGVLALVDPRSWLIGPPVFSDVLSRFPGGYSPLSNAASGARLPAYGINLVLPTVLALVGIAVVALLHRRDPGADPARLVGRFRPVLEHGFRVDAIYDRVLVTPVRRLAAAVVTIDRRGISAGSEGAGRLAVFAGGGLRRLQGGNVQLYATGLVGGLLVVLLVVAVAVAT